MIAVTSLWAEEKKLTLNALDIFSLIEANGDHAFAITDADFAIAQARLNQAKSALNPDLMLNAVGQNFQSIENNIAEIYGASKECMPGYDSGKKEFEVVATNFDTVRAKLTLISKKHTVLLEGLALFYNLHTSELKLRAYNEIHASAYVRWDRAKEQLKLAQIGPVEVSKALMRVEKTRLDYFVERTRNNNYRMRLEELINQPLPDELISPPIAPEITPYEADREKFAEIVLRRNPQMLALLNKSKAAGIRPSAINKLPSEEDSGNAGHSNHDRPQRNCLASKESRINALMELKRRQLRTEAHMALMNRADNFQRIIAARAEFDFAQKYLLRSQQLYSLERDTNLGEAMFKHSQAEAELIRATSAYRLESAGIAVLLGDHPSKGLERNYLASLLGPNKVFTGDFVPKSGSGFGQDDQNKLN